MNFQELEKFRNNLINMKKSITSEKPQRFH